MSVTFGKMPFSNALFSHSHLLIQILDQQDNLTGVEQPKVVVVQVPKSSDVIFSEHFNPCQELSKRYKSKQNLYSGQMDLKILSGLVLAACWKFWQFFMLRVRHKYVTSILQ